MELILKGALELAGEKGLKELSARNLSKRLNMSVANLYHHFQNMNEILVKATIYYYDLLRNEAMPKEYSGIEDFYIKLETNVLDFLVKNKKIAEGFNLISSNYANNENYQKELFEKYQKNTSTVEKAVRDMLPENITNEDAEDFILGMVFVRESIHQLVVAGGYKPVYMRVWKRMLRIMIKEILEKYSNS